MKIGNNKKICNTVSPSELMLIHHVKWAERARIHRDRGRKDLARQSARYAREDWDSYLAARRATD